MTYKEILLSEDPVGTIRGLSRSGTLGKAYPELEALKMPESKGRHKDNFEHSLKVLENAISLEAGKVDLVLRTAALLHDVGKPDTRRFNGNKVTFIGHPEAGARIARKVLKNEYSKVEVNEISLLIVLHMRGYGFAERDWSESAFRRLMVDAGSEVQLARLIKIFRSDLTSANPKLHHRVLEGIAKLEKGIIATKESDARAARRPSINGNDVMLLTGLSQGRDLGEVMRFLNKDEIIELPKEEAIERLKEAFPTLF